MVDESKAKPLETYDYNDYVFCDTSAWVWVGAAVPANPNLNQIYIAGTQANAAGLSIPMAATPAPAPGGPPTSIGPQFPWPYHGVGPGPAVLPAFAANGLINPLNVAPVQKTLIRVVTNDMFVYFLNRRMAAYLYATLLANPMLADGLPMAEGGPGTLAVPRWALPVPVLLQADIGLYEFERKWIWLLYVRAAADADADLHVYMEG